MTEHAARLVHELVRIERLSRIAGAVGHQEFMPRPCGSHHQTRGEGKWVEHVEGGVSYHTHACC